MKQNSERRNPLLCRVQHLTVDKNAEKSDAEVEISPMMQEEETPVVSHNVLAFDLTNYEPDHIRNQRLNEHNERLDIRFFQQVVYQLGAKQIKSSAYHPELQGALERFHSTLKNMMQTYCLDNEKDWNEGVNLLLSAVRESVQETLGFSPFELVSGHLVRGPLKLLKEQLLEDNPKELHLLDYVSKFRSRLLCAYELAPENMKSSQVKNVYDRKAEVLSW
ncbi:uncharacterized protein LOC111085537 [Limulus polyphemus]|uniref:Uncharacterized protein LOC111085537 n=1 Tax=Limulus polyphemus TaxID=6850 RepID=A0ABM1S9F8_LIMPO|nr:uncharacterized protein LOC111085537 [Limulus polyphemus]